MDPHHQQAKVVTFEQASAHVAAAQAAGQRVVLTNGCFDLLHLGHARLVQEARSYGDLLLVAINSDDSVRRLKGSGRPILPQDERAALLAMFPFVDLVLVFDEDEPLRLLERLRPDVLVKGGDYVPETVVGRDLVEGYGGQVRIVGFLPGSSTSQIIDRILAAGREGEP